MKSRLKPLLFALLVIAQLGVLGLMILDRHQLKATGTRIRLECQPVDPRSLLSGDYVILTYQISSFDQDELQRLLKGPEDFKKGREIWIALEKNQATGFHEPTGIAGDRSELKNAALVLRGRIRQAWSGHLEVLYGLEQYFVPQNEGKELEKNRLRDTSVEVAVNDDGDSAVVAIFVGGTEVKFH